MNASASARLKINRLHFIGIGGSGMSGIAEVLAHQGFEISGSDLNLNDATAKLVKIGCRIYPGHHPANVKNAQAVVVSSAIRADNVEIIAARAQNIPIVPRAEMLAELMRFRFGIAVSGTHGKTTTTSLIAHILSSAGLDPTFIIGGILKARGDNAKLGGGEYLVAEADESDASFLRLQPLIEVVTNIDRDHLGTYGGDFQNLHNAFLAFIANLPFYGVCILCIEDANVRALIDKIHRPMVRYGFSKAADIRAENIHQEATMTRFRLVDSLRRQHFELRLGLIGAHNILNALGAVAVALELEVDVAMIEKALADFPGVRRRLDDYGKQKIGGRTVIAFDDYAHHPNEIRAVFDTLKKTRPHQKITVVFEPHRYSRTHDLFDDFATVLASADALILMEIYPAGEVKIAGVSAENLAAEILKKNDMSVLVCENLEAVVETLRSGKNLHDILLIIGAGEIAGLTQKLGWKRADEC